MVTEEMMNQKKIRENEQLNTNNLTAVKKLSTSIKKNYNLLFHPHKIDFPANCTPEEYQQAVQNHYRQKAELHEKLGAAQFQTIVFKAERLKYKVLKKFGRKFLKSYDKHLDKKRDKILKKKHCKQEIIDIFRYDKMMLRKEMIYEQNRNYHLKLDATTNFMDYLNWNKEIHKGWLKFDGKVMSGAFIGAMLGISPIVSTTVFTIAAIGAVKNVYCINLQEYNIARLKEKEEKLNKIKAKQQERDVKRYHQAAIPVTKALAKTKDLVTPESIIENIETKEQLEQLKQLIENTKKQRDTIGKPKEKAKEKHKVK